MSKPIRKRRRPDTQQEHTHKRVLPFKPETQKRLLIYAGIIVLAGIPFAMGKYFEIKYPDPFDSGSYVYSAQHVLSGARVGYEEKPSAQAGTLLVNMLGVSLSGFNETGSKVLQGLFQAAALILMFITIRRLYGTLAGVISVAVASVYLSAPVIAKYGNVKEQFMIALMIMGVCCFVYYRLSGRWWWAVLTGTLLIGGPMFKQTGVSAIAAVGLFVLSQPLLRHYGWKKVGVDVLLLAAGAAVTLTPICVWYASMDTPLYYWPYSFALSPVFKLLGADMEYVTDTGETKELTESRTESVPPPDRGQDGSLILRLLPGYVSDSWRMLDAAQRKEAFSRVLRYYRVLILPIALAIGAILARIIVLLRLRLRKTTAKVEPDMGGFVLLFGLWWFFDMAFVWISPHSYEQYYLPLNASSAVLAGYLVGRFAHRLRTDRDRARWIVVGLVSVLAMIGTSRHIFFGVTRIPHSGHLYADLNPRHPRDKGYVQKWREIAAHPTYDWKQVGDYIREHSEPNDPIYVWGWVPGIYVQAQRMSPTPKAFEGMMHTLPPEQLVQRIREIANAFEKNPPRFIVDTRKVHFPWNRPPLELWPNIQNGLRLVANPPADRQQLWFALLRTFDVQVDDLTREGFLRPDRTDAVRRFEAAFAKALGERVDPAEAKRFEAIKPLRDYVMQNYVVVRAFGNHVLFQRK